MPACRRAARQASGSSPVRRDVAKRGSIGSLRAGSAADSSTRPGSASPLRRTNASRLSTSAPSGARGSSGSTGVAIVAATPCRSASHVESSPKPASRLRSERASTSASARSPSHAASAASATSSSRGVPAGDPSSSSSVARSGVPAPTRASRLPSETITSGSSTARTAVRPERHPTPRVVSVSVRRRLPTDSSPPRERVARASRARRGRRTAARSPAATTYGAGLARRP